MFRAGAKYVKCCEVSQKLKSEQLKPDIRTTSDYQSDNTVNVRASKIFENLMNQLADPYFHKLQKIDMLIGADTFFEILSAIQIKEGPIVQNTLVGWIASGRYTPKCREKTHAVNLSWQEESYTSIDKTLQKFWSLEELPSAKKVRTVEQQLCESHFQDNLEILPSGRFKVRLPFKSDPNQLGNSFEVSKRRFCRLKDAGLEILKLSVCTDFMEEYLTLRQMSEIDDQTPSTPDYFIPHQCVLRPQSTSSK
ncbi:uncharacterized protein LOC135430712 [Drosophila montana]|uniref:uncharacterized protein LOC135430712 n=1 Tax=Drosophila montana TaxID=40370 RepID=UPI00313AA391